MKMKSIKIAGIAALVGLLMTSRLDAQVQVGLHGSRIISERGDWGGGIFAKAFIADNFLIGATVKGYPKRLTSETTMIAGRDYRRSQGDVFIPVAGTIDIFFGKGVFRPYIGTDIGAYYHQYFYRLDDDSNGQNVYDYNRKQTHFGVGPRFGASLTSGILGVFAQFQYNYLFGSNGEDIIVPGINANITTNPVRSFTTVDVGVSFNLGGTAE